MTHSDLLAALLAAARTAGADAADAILVAGIALDVQLRLGETEHLERSEGRDLGLRVFVGRRAAMVSSTAADPAGFARLAEHAVAMARVVPEDPYAALAEEAAPPETAGLDLADSAEPDAPALIARARIAEDAARAVAGVSNSEGGSAGYGRTEVFLATSAGFAGQYVRTSHSVSATALAGAGTAMQRDYDYSSATHLADLEDAAGIGRTAGERAVARMNPTRPKTTRLSVVYDPRVASSLKDKLGQRIFAPGITVVDDPRRARGPRSRPFDGEGVPTRRRQLVEDGVLATWLLDSRSARQLGMKTTGHASRGTGGPPSPGATNLYLQPGPLPPAALMADIKEGLYITELIGMGVNGVTGDYSRGVAGFMIRDGALAEPVAEITVAGTLQEMFRNLTPASDLRFRRGTDAPTVRIDGMMLAGS